jgi:hypothetical protein
MKFKADEVIKDISDDKDLFCHAPECPNRWTVDNGSKLCTAHAWGNYRDWDSITTEQWSIYRSNGDKNNYDAAFAKKNTPVLPITQHEKQQILKNLAKLLKGNHA